MVCISLGHASIGVWCGVVVRLDFEAEGAVPSSSCSHITLSRHATSLVLGVLDPSTTRPRRTLATPIAFLLSTVVPQVKGRSLIQNLWCSPHQQAARGSISPGPASDPAFGQSLQPEHDHVDDCHLIHYPSRDFLDFEDVGGAEESNPLGFGE